MPPNTEEGEERFVQPWQCSASVLAFWRVHPRHEEWEMILSYISNHWAIGSEMCVAAGAKSGDTLLVTVSAHLEMQLRLQLLPLGVDPDTLVWRSTVKSLLKRDPVHTFMMDERYQAPFAS